MAEGRQHRIQYRTCAGLTLGGLDQDMHCPRLGDGWIKEVFQLFEPVEWHKLAQVPRPETHLLDPTLLRCVYIDEVEQGVTEVNVHPRVRVMRLNGIFQVMHCLSRIELD